MNALGKLVGSVGLFEQQINNFNDVETFLNGPAEVMHLDNGITFVYRSQHPSELKRAEMNAVIVSNGDEQILYGNCLFYNETLSDDEFHLKPLRKDQIDWIIKNSNQAFVPFENKNIPVMVIKHSIC